MAPSLKDKVALVAGATRGAGRRIAVGLGAAGAPVYCTGRSGEGRRSEMNRPETIEETAALIDRAGGRGTPRRRDPLAPAEVRTLVDRIEREQGRLDILVNDIFGLTKMEWSKTVWESDLEEGLRLFHRAVDTHVITSHFALPLMLRQPGGLVIEINDGIRAYNSEHYRVSFFYDLCKGTIDRVAFALAHERKGRGATVVSLTPGWLRSEAMLDAYQVSEANWRDAIKRQPHFGITETPHFVGRAVANLAQDPERARWHGQSLSSGGLAQVYGFTDLDGSRPDAWRYLVEGQDAGKPADGTGDR